MHTKIFTDENNDFWGLLEKAHGWGKTVPRLMAVGAGEQYVEFIIIQSQIKPTKHSICSQLTENQ